MSGTDPKQGGYISLFGFKNYARLYYNDVCDQESLTFKYIVENFIVIFSSLSQQHLHELLMN